jgi:hypothetical protein
MDAMTTSRRSTPGSIALCLALSLTAATAALAEGFQSFQGSTANNLHFARPNNDCQPSGQTSRFSAQKFVLEQAALCNVYSAQSYNGTVHVYGANFNAGAPLAGCLAGNDDGDLGGGSSTLRNLSLPAGTYTLVNSGFGVNDSGSFSNTIHCGTPMGTQPFIHNVQPRQGRCGSLDETFAGIPKTQQVCLHDRFPVAITNISQSDTGLGTPVRAGSRDTGIFWFFEDTNWEVMVKVLNGCGINDHWWVFIGALTDRGYTISVADPVSPTTPIRNYTNLAGNRAEAVADTTAFPCLPNE